MGVWAEHGTSWYNCNRFEEKSGLDARDAQAKSRQSLERYLHYYNRYANHEQSAKLDKDIYIKTEKKMTQLQTTANMSWIDVQFLEAASQALQRCRQTLKWTYAFAFYLARNNKTEMFEDNQKDLEMAVENLSEMFEKSVDQIGGLKREILDKTTYCNNRRVVLLTHTAEELKKGTFTPIFLTDNSEEHVLILVNRWLGVQRRSVISSNRSREILILLTCGILCNSSPAASMEERERISSLNSTVQQTHATSHAHSMAQRSSP